MSLNILADIAIGFGIPLITGILYFSRRIQQKHVWLMIWGFAVGSIWEFGFCFFRDTMYTVLVEWPLPKITMTLSHTFWDAGLFIIGYWLCLLVLKTPDCCTRFRWSELSIMLLWGAGQEFVVELLGNGVIWEYKVHSWNPIWISIGEQGYTVIPQLIWVIAPIVYYLGFIRINRSSEAFT